MVERLGSCEREVEQGNHWQVGRILAVGLLGSLVEVGRGMLPAGRGIRVVAPGRVDRNQR